MTPVELVLSKLPDAKRNGKGWTARCPAHDDRRPSLSVNEGKNSKALVFCFAGCSKPEVVTALGLRMRDLMPTDTLTTDRIGRKRPQRRVLSASTPKDSRKKYRTAREAATELEKQLGPRSAYWVYHNANNDPVGVVYRWDTPEGKTIRPVSLNGTNWVIGGMPVPRPLYYLPELGSAHRVYICEGEKVADAVRSIGLAATTSPHGSKSAGKADWSPLAGKECMILPDHDDAGGRYADDVTGLLMKLTPTPTANRVELPDLPPGGDAVEYIAARRAAGLDDDAIRAEIEHMADAAEAIVPDDSDAALPAPRIEVYKPFPTNALPEPVRSFVTTSAKAVGCDPSYIALPMLSALASAIGNTRRIQLKRGWTEPPIIWTATIGESGTLKTPAFKLAMKPIRDLQGDALKRHAEEQAEYEGELLRYEKALATWKRSKAGDDDPPEKPQVPHAVRYIVSDTTVEALAPILLANPRGLLLARDELAGWIGSFDRYSGGKGSADAAHWLSMHNGENVIVDRKTGQTRTIYVPSAAVSVTGGVQPGILNRIMGVEHRESGLLARLLLAMPPRRPRRWTEAEIPARAEAAIRRIVDRLFTLEPDRDDGADPQPRIITMTPAGKAAWITFYNAHADEHADLSGDLSAAWSKLEGYAARLALVVHFVRWAADDATLADADRVDETSIATGVELSRWFGSETRHIYGVLSESDDDRDRRGLVELIQRKGDAVTVRDWQRARSHKTAADAEAELTGLIEAGYGQWQVNPQTGPGRPTKRFVLASDGTDTDKTPEDGPEAGIVSVSEVSDDGDGTTGVEGAPDDEWGEI